MSYDVCLRTVARLADHTHFALRKNETAMRKGPYPYYGDLFERFMVDDYGVEAPGVIFLAAAGRVLNPDGTFRAALEHGRCGSGAFAHVLVPHDPNDAAYLFACITTLPNALDYIGGANHLQTLDEMAVLRMALPWPCRATRDAYVASLAACDEHVSAAQERLAAVRASLKEAEEAGQSEGVCATLRDERAAANAAYNTACKTRADLVRNFMEFGVLDGCDCTPVEPDRVEGVFHYSDAKAERAREELRGARERAAFERGGLAVSPALHASLGVLAPLVETCSFGLGKSDLTWELAPLAVVRACAPTRTWDTLLRAADMPSSLVATLDDALAELASSDPCFSLLPNLSYTTSLLAPEQLAVWVRRLDAIDPASLDSITVRAVFDVALGAASIPDDVVSIVAAAARAILGQDDAVYLPYAGHGSLVDAVSGIAIDAKLYAQCADTAALLELLAVRGVARARCGTSRCSAPADACAPAETALVADAYAGVYAKLVVLDVPTDTAPWLPVPPRRDDPRWVLGTPTRMRGAYAWIQQALAHLAPGGRVVAVLPTHELQTNASIDKGLRCALVEQERVHAVVSLPPRIWGDDRPPASLLVLGEKGSAPACLVVDALAMDTFGDEAVFGENPQRRLASGAAERIGSLLAAWLANGLEPVGCAGFARVAPCSELVANACLLAPWLLV